MIKIADDLKKGDVVVKESIPYQVDYIDHYRLHLPGIRGEHPHVYIQTSDGEEWFLNLGEKVEIVNP